MASRVWRRIVPPSSVSTRTRRSSAPLWLGVNDKHRSVRAIRELPENEKTTNAQEYPKSRVSSVSNSRRWSVGNDPVPVQPVGAVRAEKQEARRNMMGNQSQHKRVFFYGQRYSAQSSTNRLQSFALLFWPAPTNRYQSGSSTIIATWRSEATPVSTPAARSKRSLIWCGLAFRCCGKYLLPPYFRKFNDRSDLG